MSLTFRNARRDEVPLIVALLADDVLGQGREAANTADTADTAPYFVAFDAMQNEASNAVLVAEQDGEIVATYQLTFISGLSLKASRRAQIESVRVARSVRGQGVGAKLMADAEARSRAAGCSLLQLTSNKSRSRALEFYQRLGFTASHIGFKRGLE